MQKSNKKNQGCRKMAKNCGVSLFARELASGLRNEGRYHGLKQPPRTFAASGKDGLLRNFLNAIFLRPVSVN
jgi:hypothetical protein